MRKAHKTLLWVLAALGILSGAVAHGQVSLNSLAPNTVVGRLGAGQTGGAQAIPFATLLAQLNGLPSLISGPGSVTSGHVVTWGASNTSLLDSGIASSLVAQNATASPAAGCVQFDGSSHLTSTGANCGNAGATAPGGSNTQVQYNSSGAFAGSANFIYNGAVVLNHSGGAAPTSPFGSPIFQIVNAVSAGASGIEMYTATAPSDIYLYNSNGTIASPTATTGNIANISFRGFDTSAYFEGALIQVNATQTWTSSAHGTQIIFETTPNGSSTENTALTIGQDKSLAIAGAATVTGALTAINSGNILNLPLGGNTTLGSDTALAILRTDNSHNLVSEPTAIITSHFVTENQSGIANTSLTLTNYGVDVPNSGFAVLSDSPGILIVSLEAVPAPQINTSGAANAGSFVPGATPNGGYLGQWLAEGYSGSAWAVGGQIEVQATQNWTGANQGTEFHVWIIPQGSTSLIEAMILSGTAATFAKALVAPDMVLTSAAPTNAGGISYGGTTAAASNCGSLASSAGCVVINVAGTTRYIPYY